jgi:23S rRNA (uracil1939-C5)-methyltransferase
MSKKKPLPIEEVYISKLVHGGQGLGELSTGKKCFVWGALPGETVRVQLTKKKSDWVEGFVVEVLQASIDRIDPQEPEMYLATSPWQILSYEKEAEVKQEILNETFVRENIPVTWDTFYQQDNPYNYRNKMEYNFWFDNDTETVSLALHKRGSHQKVSVVGSVLASDTINKAGTELIAYINDNGIEARPLKSVIIRSSANGMAGVSIFVTAKSITKAFNNYQPADTNVEIMYSDPKSPASIVTEVLRTSEQQLSDTLLGSTFTYSTRSFFQVNVPVYEMVLQQLANAVLASSQNSVVDMYSGVGSIGLSVVPDSKTLTMVEIDEESTNQAKINAEGKKNCNVVTATAESATEYITSNDIIILDPPRAGLHKHVTERLLEVMPDTILYVSCNPSTQARDVKMLIDGGYSINKAQGFNFFPRTPHIESLIILQKSSV